MPTDDSNHNGARSKTFVLYLPHYRDPDVAISRLCHHTESMGFTSEAHARSCGWKGDLTPVTVTIHIKPAALDAAGPLFPMGAKP